MTEQVQVPAQPEPEAQPTVAPEEVTPEVFQQMYEESVSGFPLETQAEDDLEPAAPLDEPLPEDPGTSDEMAFLRQQLADTQAQVHRLSQPQDPQSQPRTVEDAVRENNPDMTDEQAKWLVNQVATIAGPMVGNLQNQVDYLSNRQQQSDQQGVVTDFNSHVDRLMDQHQIDDGWTRKVMRHAIVNEGLERHGQGFSKELATREFITLNNERLERAQVAGEEYAETKTRTANETPPVVGPTGTRTAAESIRASVRDPKNRGMDFRGDTLTDMVSGYLDTLEKGTDNALGGSDR